MAWNDTPDSQDVYKVCIVAVVAGGVKKTMWCVNRVTHLLTHHATRFTHHGSHLKLPVLVQQHTIHHNLAVVPHVADKVPVNGRVILATGLWVASA